MTSAIERTKRQDLPAGLWVLATPIGNLADLSARAIQALSESDWIVCEDTRRTSQLLSALGISKRDGRVVRLDAHASTKEIARFVEELNEGASVTLATDAGTPGVSDPGAALVYAAHEAGIRVTPIPGPSAVVSLLSVSGFSGTPFVFRGFFPRKTGDRERELGQLATCVAARIFVWYESPQRIVEALELVAARFGDARLAVGKELTKLHEKIFAGTAAETAAAVRGEIDAEGALGEWTFGIELGEVTVKDETWVTALECMLDASVSASEAAKRVSQRFGAAKNEVYRRALELMKMT